MNHVLRILCYPAPAIQDVALCPKPAVLWPISQSLGDWISCDMVCPLSIFLIHALPTVPATSWGCRHPERLLTPPCLVLSPSSSGWTGIRLPPGLLITCPFLSHLPALPNTCRLSSTAQPLTLGRKTQTQVSKTLLTLNRIIQEIRTVAEEKFWRLVL